MKLKRLITFTLTIILVICLSTPVMACTIFTAKLEDGTIIAGNNEDFMYSINNNMIVTAPSENSYGRICFYNSSYVQGGMNEYGLFYDGASCPSSEVPYDNKKEQLDYDLGEVVLSKCTTVVEVEKFFDRYNIPSSFCDHLLFADATGDSAVFEWMDGELHIIRKEQDKSYQVVTNFWLTDPSLGGYPCKRYDTASDLLQKHPSSIELFAEILNATKQDWGDGGTLYSNIYDLSDKEVFVFSRGIMNTACKVNLEQQLLSMESGTQVNYPFDELVFDTPVAITNIQEENVKEIASKPATQEENEVDISITPTTQLKSDVKTASPVSAHVKAKDTNISYWVLGISSILIIIVIATIVFRCSKKGCR